MNAELLDFIFTMLLMTIFYVGLFIAIIKRFDYKNVKVLQDRVDELELEMLFLYDIKELKDKLEAKKCQK